MHLLILGLVNKIKKNQTANKYILFLTEAYWLILSTPHNGHGADNLFLPPPPNHAPVKVTDAVATSFILSLVVMTLCF